MKRIDKQLLLKNLIKQVEDELQVAIHAAKVAHTDATNEESRPENEYDTRALEASYVARGQAQRVEELKESLFELKHLELRNFGPNDGIAATALIEVESDGKNHMLFYLPRGGGLSVNVESHRIQVITPSTPLGKALLEMKKGDDVLVEIGPHEKEYEILDVY
jgi:hypothetical protein